MKIATNLLAGTALVFATGAFAQGQTAPTGTGTMNDPMSGTQAPMESQQAATTFSDTEIERFAAAAIKIQQLEGDPAAKQQEAAQIVAQSGIEVQTFNAINEAIQTNPEVLERVQVAAAKLQEESSG
jgi:hypothetical protein